MMIVFILPLKLPCQADDFRAAMRRIFDEWQFDGICPCHGDVLRSGGKQTLTRHLGL